MTELTDTGIRIRDKAAVLFFQCGLKSVSMDDIANQLGMSKKTIYQYYADKDRLVEAVVTHIIGHNQEVCNVSRCKAKNAIDEIFIEMEQVLEMFRSMNPSLLFDMQKYYPQAYQLFLAHKNNYLFGVIKENLEKGIREGLYRKEMNVEVLTRFRLDSMLLPFHPDFQSKINVGLAELEEIITYHFLFGLVSEKGYQLTLKYLKERKKTNSR